ncbi:MAG: alkaline phosphatase D family protein [Pseudomonadota bacterium]
MQRRHFLAGSLAALGSLPLTARLNAKLKLPSTPFALGVASGDVTATSAVLWTRLAPRPERADGGMPAQAIPVRWTLARDSEFQDVARYGVAIAQPALAHSVHVELEGLEPDQSYWYRFEAAGFGSTHGRTRTLPEGARDQARFVTASCQNFTHGLFVAYDSIVADAPDFVVHLGDYIYDVAYGATFRRHETDEQPKTLEAYRRRHAHYKTDASLQRAHAALPFYCMIDNHDAIEFNDPALATQRAAAYQAWYEHMPVRGFSMARPNVFDLKRTIAIGDLAQITLLDSRQFRDERTPCDTPFDAGYGFGNYRTRCDAVFAETRSMLGQEQERWAETQVRRNPAHWNVLASPGPLLPFSYRANGEDRRYIGAWDAYPKNRERLVAAMLSAEVGHPLVLSGDVHSFWAVDGAKTPMSDEHFPLVELVTSGISANWPPPLADIVTENLAANPQVQFYDPHNRGYLLHDINHERWTTRARGVGDADQADAAAVDVVRCEITHGKSGVALTA